MKILVTGAAGFLGSHLTERLAKLGHTVVGVDSLISGDVVNFNVEYQVADTGDLIFMDEMMAQFKPDVIYHLACTPYEGLSVFSPNIVTQNTFGNTVAILTAAIRHGIKRFVYASSMSRYGAQEPPFTEFMRPRPEDPYATAKVASEQVIRQMAETHGFEYAIAVPHNIIGPRQKYDDPYRNVASIMINRNLQGKPAIIYGDGQQQRCFSFVDDCLFSLERMIDCRSGEVFNIGPDEQDGEVASIYELATLIAGLTGFNGEPIFMPDRPREVKRAFTSSEKIRREFGYQTTIKLEEGLSLMVEDIKRRGPKPFDYSFLDVEIKSERTPATWTQRLL